jgi:hypothetical protein
LFGYHRDMDGPARPLAVRRYDQLVHTLALLYVYAGMTLDQTCREDVSVNMLSHFVPNNNDDVSTGSSSESVLNPSAMKELLLDSHDNDSINSCQATCPNLYPAVAAYVLSLEVLCWSLLVPLLCLPCIYLWFLRRASNQAHSLADFHDRLREDDEDVRRNGNILAETVMAQLQDVKLVRVYNDHDLNDGKDLDEGNASDKVVIVPSGVSDTAQGKDSNGVIECCICMSDFVIQESADIDIETGVTANLEDAKAGTASTTDTIKTGATTPSLALPLPQSAVLSEAETDHDDIVQSKKCGHIFHKHCMASWVGGQWRGASLVTGEDSPRRARRTTCPLCRNDLR